LDCVPAPLRITPVIAFVEEKSNAQMWDLYVHHFVSWPSMLLAHISSDRRIRVTSTFPRTIQNKQALPGFATPNQSGLD
jgi:hypothetical protein